MGGVSGKVGSSSTQIPVTQSDVGSSSDIAATASKQTTESPAASENQRSNSPNQEAASKGAQNHAKNTASMHKLSGQLLSHNLQANLNQTNQSTVKNADIVAAGLTSGEQKRLEGNVAAQRKKIQDLENKLAELKGPSRTLTDMSFIPSVEKELAQEKKKLDTMSKELEHFKGLSERGKLAAAAEHFIQTAGPDQKNNVIFVLKHVKEKMEGAQEWQDFRRHNSNKIYEHLSPFGFRDIQGPDIQNAIEESFDLAVKTWEEMSPKDRKKLQETKFHLDPRTVQTPTQAELEPQWTTTSRAPEDKGIAYQGNTTEKRKAVKQERKEIEENRETLARMKNVKEQGVLAVVGRVVGAVTDYVADTGNKFQDGLAATGNMLASGSPRAAAATAGRPDYPGANKPVPAVVRKAAQKQAASGPGSKGPSGQTQVSSPPPIPSNKTVSSSQTIVESPPPMPSNKTMPGKPNPPSPPHGTDVGKAATQPAPAPVKPKAQPVSNKTQADGLAGVEKTVPQNHYREIMIDEALDKAEKGEIRLTDSDHKSHQRFWEWAGNSGKAPGAYIQDEGGHGQRPGVRLNVDRLTPEQRQRYLKLIGSDLL